MMTRRPFTPRTAGSFLSSLLFQFTGVLLVLTSIATAQLQPDQLLFELTEDDVTLRWLGNAQTALQRSTSLQPDRWVTLVSTQGLDTYSAPRSPDETLFFRLVHLPDEPAKGTTPRDLEWRLTEMMIHQIERAVDPLATVGQSLGETPPDTGDPDPRLNLFGGLNAYAWATQPGLIRVYSPSQRGFIRAFKLYSSPDSVANNPEDIAADEEATRQWRQTPNRFTDLNAPQPLTNGELQYPIIDPRALSMGIEGFFYPDDKILGSRINGPLPMPAEWLYVLRDGSLGTLDATDRWQGSGVISEANPIVARMAYWADDETSKLNVNTASEAIPWDVPRADTPAEREYARHQPVKGEIQRYPGHPAMTSLSSLLYPGKAANHPDATKRLTEEELRQIFALTPKAVYREDLGLPLADSKTLVADDDPTYRQTDEWIQASTQRGFDKSDRLRGFITTNNPAPEITVHGAPRMSIWPLNEVKEKTHRTAEDSRTASLASLGSETYSFLRRDPTSRHAEFYARANRHNVRLYKMIMDQSYRNTPRYGSSLAKKWLSDRCACRIVEL